MDDGQVVVEGGVLDRRRPDDRGVVHEHTAVGCLSCDGGNGRAYLHSQSGIDLDHDVTAGTRIPVGDEPDLLQHLATCAPHHQYFASGISDIFHMDETAVRNPQAIVDIIRGAFRQGMRDFTFNLDNNEFVRITGYLVRKSDLVEAIKARQAGGASAPVASAPSTPATATTSASSSAL